MTTARIIELVSAFLKPELCGPCGGKCCKYMPGSCLPADFGGDMQRIRDAIRSGRYTVDSWEGDPRDGKNEMSECYYVRPTVKGQEGRVYHEGWGGTPCTFLGQTGCSLDVEDRPSGCRGLEPINTDGRCKVHYGGKQDAAVAWIPLQSFLAEIVERGTP